MREDSRGRLFRDAVAAESPLQVVGTITAYAARMAQATGYRAIYLSGGGVAANSLGMPDLGISTLDDVITDAQRITEACSLPLLVDIDTGWGGAFNIARTIRHMIRADVAAVHMEDQVSSKRCGHRPGKEIVSKDEMVDRIKAAVDARTDGSGLRLCSCRGRYDFSRSHHRAFDVQAVSYRSEGAHSCKPDRVWSHPLLYA